MALVTGANLATAPALSQSPLLWALEAVRLPTPEGLQPFRPYSYQARLLSDRSPRVLVLKSRQVGITLTAALRVAHEALFKPQSLPLVISGDQDAAAHVLDIVYGVLDGLDEPPRLVKRNAFEAGLENGARIGWQPAKEKPGGGQPGHRAVLREFGCVG